MSKKKKHLLTDEELRQLKDIRHRKTIVTADGDTLEAIYKRMNPNYDLCKTCLDTLASEAMSLIGYAEKQLGYSILKFEEEEKAGTAEVVTEEQADTTDSKTQEPKKEPVKESAPANTSTDSPKIDDYMIEGRLTDLGLLKYIEEQKRVTLTAEVKALTGEKLHKVACEILGITSEELIKLIVPVTDGVAPEAPAEDAPIVLNHEGINGLNNADLIKYVFQKTGVELSEHADRSDLISSADDLLDDKEEETARLTVPKGGVGRMKNVDLIAYLEQETGTKYDKLERPELLKLAKQSKANEKST